jgi:alkylation response protein AidB-like acyl-CoA dehydrogenase
MDFELNEEQMMIRDTARDFAQNVLAPLAEKMDQERKMDPGILKKLGELGYLGMLAPIDVGGAEMSPLEVAFVIEEISRACASTGMLLSVHNELGVDILHKLAPEPVRERLLPDAAAGKKICAFALTEPGCGSDAAGVQCKAVRDGDNYIVNGTKIFISHSEYADIFITFVRTGPDERHKGMSALVIEKGMPGFSIGKIEKKMGLRASSTTELIFEDAVVPVANRILEEGEGFKVALSNLEGGRIGIAAQSLGIGQAALDEAVKYAKERRQFGKPITEFQGVSFKLAEMKMDVDAARLLLYRASWLYSQGKKCPMEASMAKLYASEMANRVTAQAVQIHGGYGYIEDFPVERYYRDARVLTIYEGTSEVQKMVMLKEMLK